MPAVRHGKTVAASVIAASTALLGVVVVSPAHAAPAAGCTENVGDTGLSAAVVAQAGETIADQRIRAGSCDIGIYIGADAPGVTVDNVTVTGAGFQAVFAEKTSDVTIENSRIFNNGWRTLDPNAAPLPPKNILHSEVSQSFAISLFGVAGGTVVGNQVHNNGRGGIGVMDNGANDPGAKTQHPTAPLRGSSDITVADNHIWSNDNGCALVTATQNFAGWLSGLTLSGNIINGPGFDPADSGGIVVAADPPLSSVSDVSVSGNTISHSYEGGVVVNAETPGSSTNHVTVTGNSLSRNNWGAEEAPNTAGVVIFAPAPGAANNDTTVKGNRITSQFYGVWALGPVAPTVSGNSIRVTKGGTPVSIN